MKKYDGHYNCSKIHRFLYNIQLFTVTEIVAPLEANWSFAIVYNGGRISFQEKESGS